MRNLIFLLLFLNLIYFIYYQFTKQKTHTDSITEYTQVGNSDSCLYIGGNESEETINILEQRMFAKGIDAKRIKQQLPSGIDYLVYIKSPNTHHATWRLMKEIRAHNFTANLITSGKLKDSISLGVFVNINDARTKITEIQNSGFKSQLAQLERIRHKLWLQVAKVPHIKFDSNFINSVTNNLDNVHYKISNCDEYNTVVSKK